ncbi:hypothetical protein CPB83DRAFT_843804 [Crepidotus variabilis]|uniref:Uncharacterized protein n=1 Tax=Crepidotus variabilis TaxID=179855 RepID=A0A9P6JVR8_9AGAR|nr:hypothetical protein CPB83DRAFT_843804 [Crepidotus variabilis]
MLKKTIDTLQKDTSHQIITGVFGPQAIASEKEINHVLEMLNAGQVLIESTDIATMKKNLVAITPVQKGTMGPIQLGTEFFSKGIFLKKRQETPLMHVPIGKNADVEFRAGVLIHEATHYLAKTGDYMDTSNHVIPAGRSKKDIQHHPDGKPMVGCEWTV